MYVSFKNCMRSMSIELSLYMQMYVLDEAKRHSKQDTWWWIKADGCDILPGVAESMRGVWSGDVDLNDGHLEEQKASYKNCLSEIERLSVVDRVSLVKQLCSQIDALQKDKEFLYSGDYLSIPIFSMCVH